jgi:hypothetical protein
MKKKIRERRRKLEKKTLKLKKRYQSTMFVTSENRTILAGGVIASKPDAADIAGKEQGADGENKEGEDGDKKEDGPPVADADVMKNLSGGSMMSQEDVTTAAMGEAHGLMVRKDGKVSFRIIVLWVKRMPWAHGSEGREGEGNSN